MPRIRKEPNRYWSKEEKLRIIRKMTEESRSSTEVAIEEDISDGMLRKWVRNYLKYGEDSLQNKKKPGNPMCKFSNKKKLTKEEQLEYENIKLRIDLERLKKGYIVKGVGQNKVYITIKNKNLR